MRCLLTATDDKEARSNHVLTRPALCEAVVNGELKVVDGRVHVMLVQLHARRHLLDERTTF